MLTRLALALAVGAIAWLACILLGIVLAAVQFPLASAVGGFLTQYAVAIGAIVALFQFASGYWKAPARPLQ